MFAAISRDTTIRPVHLPSSDIELSVVSDANLQLTLMGEESASILTEPLPAQLPPSDFRNSASAAWAIPPRESAEATRNNLARDLVMKGSYRISKRKSAAGRRQPRVG